MSRLRNIMLIASALFTVDDATAQPPLFFNLPTYEITNQSNATIGLIKFEDLFNPSLWQNLPTQNLDKDTFEKEIEIEDLPVELIKPVDEGSFQEQKPAETLCSSWNSFIAPANHILELSNFDESPKEVPYFFYNQEGSLIENNTVKIEAGAQRDIVVDEFLAKQPHQIGTVCISNSKNIRGRITTYKKTDHSIQPDFVAIWPLTSGRTGTQFVSLNTFFPAIKSEDLGFVVSNWIEITNISPAVATGSLTIFDHAGKVIELTQLTLQPYSRLDIPGHILGKHSVGSAKWEPNSKDSIVILNNSRYYHDNEQFIESHLAATVINGSNSTNSFTTSTKNKSTSIIEIINPSPETSTVEISYRDKATLVESFTITLDPNSSYHLITNEITTKDSVFTLDSESAFVAQHLSYNYNSSATLKSVASHGKLSQSTKNLTSSYNTFLGQKCHLTVFNHSTTGEEIMLTMVRDSGRVLLGSPFTTFSTQPTGEPYFIDGNSSIEINLCQHEEEDNIGTVSLFSSTGTAEVSAFLTRTTSDNSSTEFILLEELE